jgi:hypothetical protein
MPERKRKLSAATLKPSHFFTKQLAGEEPPSLATMEELFRIAVQFADLEPWKTLSEDQLIMVRGDDNQICFCSVMGALGEVLALQVYTGVQSYRFFQRLSAGQIHSAGDFFAEQRGVSVEFVRLKELKPPDRELLRALRHSPRSGILAPMFRANRPGYHPWYITEPEAKLLRQCLRAEMAVLNAISEQPDLPLWNRKNAYPVVEHTPEEDNPSRYWIRVENVPPEPKISPVLPVLDERKLNATLARHFPLKGVFELDHFYGSTAIGKVNERKACMRMAFAVDATSGIAFPPQVEAPFLPTGDMLVNAVYAAIEAARRLPTSIHVRNPEFKVLLTPLATALGFRVEVANSLPALDYAKHSLLSVLGGEDPLQY